MIDDPAARRLFWEDMKPGQNWRTEEYEITAGEIIEFARRYDPMPMHLGAESARSTPLGLFCASGIHTFGITHKLLCEKLFLHTALVAGGEINHFVMRRPVLPGDVLSATITATQKRENARRLDTAWIDFTVETIRSDSYPVLEYTASILFRRRETAMAASESQTGSAFVHPMI